MKNRNNIFNEFRYCMYIHIALLIINVSCNFLNAYYLASFIQNFSDVSYNRGVKIIGRLAIVNVVQLVISYVKNRYWKAYREMKINELETSIYRKYLETSIQLDNESTLSIVCEKDVSELTNFYTETIPLIVQAIMGVSIYAVFLVVKVEGIGILVLLSLLGLFQFLPAIITERYLVQNYIRAGQEEAELRQQVVSGMSGILTIKLLNLEEWFMNKYLQRQKIFQKVGECAAATSSVQAALNSGVSLIQQLGILLIGVWGVTCEWLTLDSVIEGYVLSSSFYQYMARLGMIKAQYGVCRAAEERINSLFHNDSSRQLFTQLDMKLPEKGFWIVKGENGAGKSTLFSLISGCSHYRERIIWKEKELGIQERMDKIAWCPQSYLQLSDSFNTLIGIIPEEIIEISYFYECIKAFRLNREVMAKPLNKLSGGEQKKLMISLALARKSDILLLDEPEVSLDQMSVKVLKELLEKEKRLVLLVTHITIFDDIADGVMRVERGNVYV